MLRRTAALVLAGASLAGCKSDNGGTQPPSATYSLSIHSGDGQSGQGGSVLDEPLTVTVQDAAHVPVRGVVVHFQVSAGGGSVLLDSVGVSNFEGVASTQLRIGSALDTTRVLASVGNGDDQQVTFKAVSTPAPTVTSVTPSTFKAGDTIVVRGAHFNSAVSGNAVFVGPSRARIISASGDSVLRALAPPCVAPGSVPVVVRVGTSQTAAVNATYSAAAPLVALAALEGITVSGTELGSCLQLPGNGAKYLLVPQYASVGSSTTATPFEIGSVATAASLFTPASTESAVPGLNRVQDRFDRGLRMIERRIAADVAASRAGDLGESVPLAALTLNSTRKFSVLKDLEGTGFTSTSAKLKYIGTNILLYFDANSPTSMTDAELQQFGKLFDVDLYPLDVKAFGSESDIDNNQRVIVLMSSAVNKLTPTAQCGDGFVTGYFFGHDLSTFAGSNRSEVFYALTPDNEGSVSCAHSTAQVKRIVPATFVHEFQHMISFNQHVLARNGSAEDVWLNEGLSHIAEELGSKFYEAKCPPPSCRGTSTQMFPDSSQGFIVPDLLNAYDYLAASTSNSVTTFEDFGTLEERGAAWLFLRWLGDLKGESIYGRLVQTSKTSRTNVEDKTGESFASLFGDFGIAVYADSIPGVGRPANVRYRIPSRNLRYIYDRMYNTSSNAFGLSRGPFPIAPSNLAFGGTFGGSMVQGTFDFFTVTAPTPSTPIALKFGKAGGGTFPSNLEAQLSIFRLQ